MDFIMGDVFDHEKMEELFNSLDADKDGKLSMNELMGVLEDRTDEPALEEFFKACDKNGDKRITLKEFHDFYIDMDDSFDDSSDSDDEEMCNKKKTLEKKETKVDVVSSSSQADRTRVTNTDSPTKPQDDVRRATLLNIHKVLQDLDQRVAADYLTTLQQYHYTL